MTQILFFVFSVLLFNVLAQKTTIKGKNYVRHTTTARLIGGPIPTEIFEILTMNSSTPVDSPTPTYPLGGIPILITEDVKTVMTRMMIPLIPFHEDNGKYNEMLKKFLVSNKISLTGNSVNSEHVKTRVPRISEIKDRLQQTSILMKNLQNAISEVLTKNGAKMTNGNHAALSHIYRLLQLRRIPIFDLVELTEELSTQNIEDQWITIFVALEDLIPRYMRSAVTYLLENLQTGNLVMTQVNSDIFVKNLNVEKISYFAFPQQLLHQIPEKYKEELGETGAALFTIVREHGQLTPKLLDYFIENLPRNGIKVIEIGQRMLTDEENKIVAKAGRKSLEQYLQRPSLILQNILMAIVANAFQGVEHYQKLLRDFEIPRENYVDNLLLPAFVSVALKYNVQLLKNMAFLSKMHPSAAGVTCQELVHPFTSSCTMAALDMVLAGGYGSAKFMLVIYLLNFFLRLSRGKKDAKKFLSVKTLKSYLRSVSYAACASVTFMIVNCSSRWICDGYNSFNCCFFPSFVAGLSILLEAPSRRNLVITSYANMSLDALLRRCEEVGLISWSKISLTFSFMVLNSILLFLRRFGNANQHSVWFFTPGETETNDKIWQSKAKNQFMSYFAAGIAVSAARLVFSDLTLLINPISFLAKLLTGKNLALGAFLGSYVTVYQLVDHYLTQVPLAERTVLAGFLSGMTLWLQPSQTILSSAAINVFQIVLELYQRSGKIPRLPYEVLLFCFYNGLLYYMRAMNPSAVPRTFIRIMTLVTSRRSDNIYKYYADIIKKAVVYLGDSFETLCRSCS